MRLTKARKDELRRLLPEGRVLFDEPMASHSSIGVGGPSECFIVIRTTEELKQVIGWAQDYGVEYHFWGGGSNTLVRDGGIKGLVIKLGAEFGNIEEERSDGESIYVRVGASLATPMLVRFATERGLMGVEGLAGCFGTVGGNLMTNAGTKAGYIGDVVHEIQIVDREGRELSLKRVVLKFGYRSLKLPRTTAVIGALLRLVRSSARDVASKVDEILKRRGETQPIHAKSLGCIFKNPEKVSAGALIEDAGLKGVRVGGARVSSVHANFIVNEGRATAKDIIVLINLVRERVRENSSIGLETEIEIIGNE